MTRAIQSVLSGIGGLLIICSTASHAQQPFVQEVVIETSRIPQSISKLPLSASLVDGGAVQRAQPQLGLDESLVKVPGLFLQNRFNFAQDLRVSIRGFGARANFGIRGVKILVDGIPETLADGQGGVDSIDLASVGKIEVIRGPASSLYGNASGGVINIYTEFDTEVPEVETRFAIGDNGYRKYQVKSKGSTDRLSYILSGSDLEYDGFRDHSEAENRQINSRLRYRFNDDSRLNMVLSYTDQPVANDPGGVNLATFNSNPRAANSFANVANDTGEALDQTRVGFLYTRAIDSDSELTLRNYYVWRNFIGKIPPRIIDLERFYSGAGIMYTRAYQVAERDNTTIIGIDYDRQDDDRLNFSNNGGSAGALELDQRELVTSVGIYVQNQLWLNDAWLVTSGLRFDEVTFDVDDELGGRSGNRTLSELSPMLGSTYTVNPSVNIYGNISTAFETPTTTELAPSNSTGLNPDLNPQDAINYELGVKGVIDNRYRYALAVFKIDVDDEIIAMEDASNDTFFQNAGESSREGVEFSIASQLHDWLDASLAYTWSDFEFDEFIDQNSNNFSGNDIPGLPQQVVHLQFDFHHPDGFFATAEAQYVDDFALDNANSAFTDAYTVVNIRSGYRLDFDSLSVEPFIGLNNALDEDYAANTRINGFNGNFFEAAPDRNFFGGVSLRYQFANN